VQLFRLPFLLSLSYTVFVCIYLVLTW